ncbi:hypothetical protein HanOQP8_Chr03g0093091 [Helianthus annuus]|nr:hypothetical protein HanOQP8_Chr03g0093091 [Helianthus annuus]
MKKISECSSTARRTLRTGPEKTPAKKKSKTLVRKQKGEDMIYVCMYGVKVV